MSQSESSPEAPTREASPTSSSGGEHLDGLRARISELQRERDDLVSVVEILQDSSASLHFADISQTIARRLGERFGLDRCSIFLAGDAEDVRLVASYDDPAARNLVVDLERYPELKRAFDSGETVFIADAASEPLPDDARAALDVRNVRSIVVVPIRWRDAVIGAIFLRTERDAQPFSEQDVAFCQIVASLTAKTLRNAHRFAALLRSTEEARSGRRAELERIALLAFLRRLFDRYARREDHLWAETLLPRESDEELERLVSVAIQVIEEEARG